MNREKIYLSTIASDAPLFAREYGFGLEIAEYSTAWNMDRRFEVTDSRVRESLKGISRSILHAPVNELFPCAVDEKARELAGKDGVLLAYGSLYMLGDIVLAAKSV